MSQSRVEPGTGLRLSLDVGCEDGVTPPFDDAWFERVARAALNAAGTIGRVEIALLLAGDATLHRFNREYRQVDRPTDVLAFAQEEEGAAPFHAPPGEWRHLGDVALSVERVQRQAVEHGHTFERELGYLLTHGVLHLVGFDHQTDADQAKMRRVEEQALASINLTRTPTTPASQVAAPDLPRRPERSEGPAAPGHESRPGRIAAYPIVVARLGSTR